MFQNNFLKIPISAKSSNMADIYDVNSVVSEAGILISKPKIAKKLVVRIAQVAILVVFLGLSFRLAIIQVYTAPIWQDWSSRSSNQLIYILAPRGRILDRNGKVLVDNQVSFSIVTPLKNLQDQTKRDLIKSRLELSEVELNQIAETGYAGFVKLKSGLSSDQMLAIADIADRLEIELIPEYNRSYLDKNNPDNTGKNESLAGIVGYTGFPTPAQMTALDKDIYKTDSRIGLVGLEKSYEPFLQGLPGKIEKRSIVKNTDRNDKVVIDPVLGTDITTSVDLDLQLKIYNLTKDEYQKANIKSGSIVLMNAQNGEIKALLNFPSYDPASFEDKKEQFKLQGYFNDSLRPLFNRATRGQYPPGSSIKPFVGAVALENGIVKPGQEILDSGSLQVKSKIVEGRVDNFINYKSTYLGVIDLASAIAKSSDVFFYYLVGGDPETGKVPFLGNEQAQNPLGVDKLDQDLSKFFGFGQKTNIDLEFENIGVLPTPEYKQKIGLGNWYLGDAYQTAIGQGFFLVTPVQMARALAVFANGGYLVQPHFNTNLEVEHKSSGLNPTTVDFIQKAMRGVVMTGTAKKLQDNKSQIAAKTGSAQFDPKNPDRIYGWVMSYNQSREVIKDSLVLIVLTEDIDKTAEYITVPITNKIWQEVEKSYEGKQTQP